MFMAISIQWLVGVLSGLLGVTVTAIIYLVRRSRQQGKQEAGEEKDIENVKDEVQQLKSEINDNGFADAEGFENLDKKVDDIVEQQQTDHVIIKGNAQKITNLDKRIGSLNEDIHEIRAYLMSDK